MITSLTVLQAFPAARSTTNPYLIMLADSLRAIPGIHVLNFSWKTALLRRFDVFHVHWPEILVNGQTPLKKLVRQILTLALILKLAMTRTPIVRTVHNVRIPDGISLRETLILKLIERRTTYCVTLNPQTIPLKGKPSSIILHGHYRDWFSAHPRANVESGRIGYFGLIRRYKGVEGLISAFRDTGALEPGLSLHIGGKPSTAKLSTELTDLASDDERIRLDLKFISDEELVDTVTSSELIVLPYRFMHNSGGALAALSLHRPVLLPDNTVNRQLADEMGDGWVYLFKGELTAHDIVRTVHKVRRQDRSSTPDLGARAWNDAGTQHVRAYRRAMSLLEHKRKAA